VRVGSLPPQVSSEKKQHLAGLESLEPYSCFLVAAGVDREVLL